MSAEPTLPRRQVSMEEMQARTARFDSLESSRMPLIDAALPQFQREIFTIIGSGVLEDPAVRPPITAVDGFHLSIVRAKPGMGTGLHNHRTVEVFMPLTGIWAIQWNDDGSSELQLGPYDVVSVPPGVMRGFRNDSGDEAMLLVVVGGTDPGQVDWTAEVLNAAAERGFTRSGDGRIASVRCA